MSTGNSKKLVGRAWRGNDGVIRWVTHANRGYLYLLCLNEEFGVWHDGRRLHFREFDLIDGAEVIPPQPGETYQLGGPFGRPSTLTVPFPAQITNSKA